ncbi:MAG: hypothetical protein LBR85_06140 [Oscillospiraceae bacterium]|jgi:flagellar capping protein FliD|nr:hypothetical protein [Oscillospiraceae bacterium]
MSPKKDSNRIYEMLAKRGLAEPVEPEVEYTSDIEPDDSARQTSEEEAMRRFFEDASVPAQQEAMPKTDSAAIGGGYWGVGETADPSEGLDTLFDVGQIYKKFGMPLNGVDTIYLIEEYIATLPDSLPAEMRRAIVLKIVSASGFNFDRLLNDGIDRVTKLNDYSASFASRTDELVAESQNEIESLTRRIEQIKERINERKNLHKRQFLAIESEAQRLKEVLDFITK